MILRELLKQKFIEDENERERQRLLGELGRLEEWLEECKKGKCPDIGESEEKCFYAPEKGCLCKPNEDGLFCEWLEHRISSIEETLANL